MLIDEFCANRTIIPAKPTKNGMSVELTLERSTDIIEASPCVIPPIANVSEKKIAQADKYRLKVHRPIIIATIIRPKIILKINKFSISQSGRKIA